MHGHWPNSVPETSSGAEAVVRGREEGMLPGCDADVRSGCFNFSVLLACFGW